jgi:hypothetical protein
MSDIDVEIDAIGQIATLPHRSHAALCFWNRERYTFCTESKLASRE